MVCEHARCGSRGRRFVGFLLLVGQAMIHWILSLTMLWAMVLLGACQGINHGMGWLFAVAWAMREPKGNAVARSLIPIAIGQYCNRRCGAGGSITRYDTAARHHSYAVAALVVSMGTYCFVRRRRPGWVRCRLVPRLDLVVVCDGLCSRRRIDGGAFPATTRRSCAEPIARLEHFSQTVTPLQGMLATVLHTSAYGCSHGWCTKRSDSQFCVKHG